MRPIHSIQELAARARPGQARRAVVVGASMAGLLAARVLADHFDEVWLLDRDGLPEGDEHRKSTPHSLHAHGLLARGREVIEGLLPGITEEWLARGARPGDLQGEVAFHGGLHRFARASSGHLAVAGSRPLIEGAVRRRVLALPRVHACTGVDVRGLRVDSHARICGVHVAPLDDSVATVAFEAALVVDASGRASRMPAWLRELGCEPPQEERVQVDIRYATCYFARQPHHVPGTEVVLHAATPRQPRPGVMLAQEGGRWVVTLGGYGDDAPPLDLQAFADRAAGLPGGEIAGTLRDAQPLCDPIGYRFAHSQRRRYERLQRFPEGVLVIGDAICSFNPIYGQGMSVAACEALALQQVLSERGRAPLARRFFRRAARIVDTPWAIAVGADLAMPSVPGARPLPVRWINAYMARVFEAAAADPVVARAFLEVSHLLAEPASLLAPRMLWRVWRARRRAAGAAAAAGQDAATTFCYAPRADSSRSSA